jgi:hypothetical protein
VSTDEHLEQFYLNVKDFSSKDHPELSCAERTTALFRVALECGAEGMGLAATMHVVSQLMTITLGLMASDENGSFESLLADFETRNEIPH